MKRRLLITLLALLVLATAASASFWNKLAEAMMESIIPWAVNLIVYPFMTLSLLALKGMLYFNPTVMCYGQPGCKLTAGIDALRPYIMEILVPFYVVAMMFVALFLITKSGSPRGRSRAKTMFFRLIIGMLFVIYAPFIYQVLMDISLMFTEFFLNGVDINKVMAFAGYGKAVSMCFLQFCMAFVMLMTAMIILVRWVYVYMYGVFFSLILFLYFFEITKPYGSKYLKQAIKWIFVPPLQALILYVMIKGPLVAMGSISVTGLPIDLRVIFTQFIGVFTVLGGMITMCAAPMIMTHILTFMGRMIYSFGLVTDSLPLMSIGGVIAGEGPAGFTAAHAHFSRLRAYEAAQSASFGGAIPTKGAPKAMRLAGSQIGAFEGHGGGVLGTQEGMGAIGEAAAARRGIPFIPSMESEIGGVRKKAHEEGSHEVVESTERQPARVEGPAEVPSSLDIESARGEAATGLNPEDIKQEREEVKSREGESPYEYLQGRGGVATPITEFAAASPESRVKTIGGVAKSIDALASEGISPEDLKPFRSMLSDMKDIHRNTMVMKKPGEIMEGDLTVKEDIGERQKTLEYNMAKAREKMATLQKQHHEKEAVRNDIAYLQRMLGHAKETREKQHDEKGR